MIDQLIQQEMALIKTLTMKVDTIGLDAAEIEAGYRQWLKAIAPRVFRAEFAPFHDEYWEWLWLLQQLRRSGQPIPEDMELSALKIFGRGLGKSTGLEFTAVTEGAQIEEAFGVYVCSTQDKANEHIAAIRDAIEASQVARYYPGLSNPRVGKFGNQRGWRQEAVYTENGFAIVGAGLDKGVRGLKDIAQRPTIFFLDDIDERSDTPLIVEKKWKTIVYDILPMAELSNPKPITIFAQNLIHRGSVMAKTLRREIPLLTHRREFGPINTFQNDLVIEKRDNRKVIIAGTPNWNRVSIPEAQVLLDNIGEDAFRSECQNEMVVSREERVWHEYDEKWHIITWSMFASVFGSQKIPQHWEIHWGHDWGTSGPTAHPAVLQLCAVASEDSPLPRDAFFFYSLTADAGTTEHQIARQVITDMPEIVWHPGAKEARNLLDQSDKATDEAMMWTLRYDAGRKLPATTARMSHEEAQNVMKTYNYKWGLAFASGNPGKTVGLSQLNHYLEPDMSRRHPFKPNVMGKPSVYFIVDDDQYLEARDDRGFARLREEALTLRWDPNIAGRDVPMKRGDDACLIAGTIVETEYGPRPIESIKAGERVWTRKGLRKVTASGLSNADAALFTLHCSNQVAITGNAFHPIWIEGRGWIPLSECCKGDMLQTWGNAHQKLSSLTASNSTDIQPRSSGLIEAISSAMSQDDGKDIPLITLPYGKPIMGVRCLTAIIYTIKTKIRSIIPLRTLNAHLAVSTAPGTYQAKSDILAEIEGSDWPERRPRHGIAPPQVGHGIVNMAYSLWQRGRRFVDSALSAVRSFGRYSDVQSIVQHYAGGATTAALTDTYLRPANTVARTSWAAQHQSAIAAQRENVIDAIGLGGSVDNALIAASTLKLTQTHPANIAQSVKVLKVVPAGRGAVYNLSIEDTPEFFANGILTHNTDAVKFIMQGFKLKATALTDAQRLEANLTAELQLQNAPSGTDWDREGWQLRRQIEIGKIEKKEKEANKEVHNAWSGWAPIGADDDPFGEE